MKKTPFALALICLSPSLSAEKLSETVRLDAQVVTADFRQTDVQQLPEAITVVSAQQIEARSAEHLEQVLSFAPNVNYSSGSSRARYFQIRGIGERSQFIDPINPSVGLIIDGIDMTGLGTAATLFDVQQVEILRGPQGTRFGANALAGLINITSNEASKTTEGYVHGKLGNYSAEGLGGAISGSLSNNIQARLAVHHFKSDGFMKNDYLNRDDTQNQNELVWRAKLAWQLSDATELKLTYLYANMNNGYDAFTLDNSRNSLADEPGKDIQKTHAGAINYHSALNDAVTLEVSLAGSKSAAIYSFDEDWVYPALDPDTYSYFDQYARNFKRHNIDVRLLSGIEDRILGNSTDWVIGVYAMERNEELLRDRRKESVWSQYSNTLNSQAISAYIELATQLSQDSRLIYGARIEHWQNDFSASDNVSGKTDEWLYGGKVTLETFFTPMQLGYTSWARGYKAGGINSDEDVSQANRTFATEYNNTAEVGLKSEWLDGNLKTRLAAFYIRRQNQQIKSSYVLPTNPPSFQDYLANAARGENYGLELESVWQLTETLAWELSYGYLKTQFLDYVRNENVYDANWNVIDSIEVDKTGRAQAHAPVHSGSTAFTWTLNALWKLRLEAEYKAEFYFSDSHDEQAPETVLYNARLSYQTKHFELAATGRNLTNVETETRGFGGFGNDPRDGWAEHKYVQLGDPRVVMLEAKYIF